MPLDSAWALSAERLLLNSRTQLAHLMTVTHSKSYSEDLRWVLVYMHHKRNMSVNEIERLTNLKSRTIRRILKLFEETGQVMPPAAKSGRPRKLDDNDIDVSDLICHSSWLFSGHAQGAFFPQYLKSCIARSGDAYLDELKKQLEDVCHVRVSMPTIWRALRQQGFTMKRVRQCYVYRTTGIIQLH
jgi:transposase